MGGVLKTKEFSRGQKGIVKLDENYVSYPPYPIGECSSHDDPKARAYLIGATMDTSREEMIQTVLEDVVYGFGDSLEMARSLDIRTDRTKTHGGGTRGLLWGKMVASITNVKVGVVENEEGPASGGTVLATVGCKKHPDVKTAADSIVEVAEAIGPGEELMEKYERQYSKFR